MNIRLRSCLVPSGSNTDPLSLTWTISYAIAQLSNSHNEKISTLVRIKIPINIHKKEWREKLQFCGQKMQFEATYWFTSLEKSFNCTFSWLDLRLHDNLATRLGSPTQNWFTTTDSKMNLTCLITSFKLTIKLTVIVNFWTKIWQRKFNYLWKSPKSWKFRHLDFSVSKRESKLRWTKT